jgi:hypothetical protein
MLQNVKASQQKLEYEEKQILVGLTPVVNFTDIFERICANILAPTKFQPTVKLGHNEQLGTGHFCSL